MGHTRGVSLRHTGTAQGRGQGPEGGGRLPVLVSKFTRPLMVLKTDSGCSKISFCMNALKLPAEEQQQHRSPSFRFIRRLTFIKTNCYAVSC